MKVLYLLGLCSALVSAFDCRAKELAQYDFDSIKGAYMAEVTKSTPPSKTTSTWSIGICQNLDSEADCPKNADLCGLTRVSVDGKTFLSEVIDVSGNSPINYIPFTNEGVNNEKGISISYNGVSWGDILVDATIKFVCVESGAENENRLKILEWDGKTFGGEMRTPAACISSGDNKKTPEKKKDNSESWGWFTWIFIFMVLFLSIYIIGGAWFQYSKGNSIDFRSALKEVLENFTDLLKGLPSFIKEIIEKVSGNSNRGEYSAV